MSVKVSSKYQVVIPTEVREALDLKPGTEVDVIAKGGIAYLVPVQELTKLSDKIRPYLTSKEARSVREKKDRKV